MSFNAYEKSRHHGQPIELFLFRYGTQPTAYYAYTDAAEAIEFENIIYRPTVIKRNNINASGTLDKANLDVSMPLNTELAELFRIYPPGQVVTLVLRQGHAEDPDAEFLVNWSGRIVSNKRDRSEATFICEPISTSMRRPGLRQNYQYGCAHVLFGAQCKANKAAATSTATVVDVGPAAITVAETIGPGYIGGMIEWNIARGLEIRSILGITDDHTLRLSGPPTGMVAGQTISVVLGCPHNLEGCETLHNNVLNFGGQPWIPSKNPINKNVYN